MTAPAFPLLIAIAAAPAGLAVGLAYFALVRKSAEQLAAGRGWLHPSLLTALRLAAAAAFFAAAARCGAAPLLAAFCGFLLARWLTVRTLRRPG
jgi:NhaP-type Na+/H+ or K+/H+ antiporter